MATIAKEELQKADNLIPSIETETLEELKPKCLNENISNMNYGTIIHSILENIDYYTLDIDSIYKNIEIVCKNKEGINISKVKNIISKYLHSDITKFVKDAKKICKEQPFVIYDDLSDIEELKLNEKTYIQGIIDLYITTKEGKNIIIDFKTDRVEKEQELIDKYKYQLLVYKKGIELSSNDKVDNMYIYSFNLNKFIKIK